MQKKIIYSTAFTAMLTASAVFAGGPEIIPVQEDFFTGFYVGGTGAIHHAVFDEDVSIETSDDLIIPASFDFDGSVIPAGTVLSTIDSDGGSIDGFGGVQGGLGKVFAHRWYLGVMAFGEWGTQKSSTTSTSNTPINTTAPVLPFGDDAVITGSATTTSTTTAKIKNDYGVAGKVGYLFTPTTMLYVKGGAEWAEISVSNSNSSSGTVNAIDDETPPDEAASFAFSASGTASDSNDTKVGWLVGIGFEQFIYQDIVSFNLEYDYASFGTVNAGPTNQTATISGSTTDDGVITPLPGFSGEIPVATEASTSVNVGTFLAGLNFYFGRSWI